MRTGASDQGAEHGHRRIDIRSEIGRGRVSGVVTGHRVEGRAQNIPPEQIAVGAGGQRVGPDGRGHAVDGLRGPGEARVLQRSPDRQARRDVVVDCGAYRRVDCLGLGGRRADGPILGGVVIDLELIALGLRVHDRGVGVVGDDGLQTVILGHGHLDGGGDLLVGGDSAGAESVQPRGGLGPQVPSVARDQSLIPQDALGHRGDVAIAQVELLGVETIVADREFSIQHGHPKSHILAGAGLVGQWLEEQVEGRTLRNKVIRAVVGEAEAADRLGHKTADSVSAIDGGFEKPEVPERTGYERKRLRFAFGLTPAGQPFVGRREVVSPQVRS